MNVTLRDFVTSDGNMILIYILTVATLFDLANDFLTCNIFFDTLHNICNILHAWVVYLVMPQ